MIVEMERGLVLLKPDVVPQAHDIIDRFKRAGYKIQQTRAIHLTEEQATDFYQSEMNSKGFSALIAFMSSGPILAMIVQKLNLIEDIPAFIGPRNPEIGRSLNPESLRAIYGKDELYNAIHYSEDIIAARREFHFFFPENEIDPRPNGDTASMFLEADIYPTLLQGMTQLCKEKPSNPTAWLGQWLLSNNPHKPKVIEA